MKERIYLSPPDVTQLEEESTVSPNPGASLTQGEVTQTPFLFLGSGEKLQSISVSHLNGHAPGEHESSIPSVPGSVDFDIVPFRDATLKISKRQREYLMLWIKSASAQTIIAVPSKVAPV